jgi:hypothetical protein
MIERASRKAIEEAVARMDEAAADNGEELTVEELSKMLKERKA